VGKNGYVPEVVGPMRWTGRRRRGELGFATPEGANQATTPDGAMPDVTTPGGDGEARALAACEIGDETQICSSSWMRSVRRCYSIRCEKDVGCLGCDLSCTPSSGTCPSRALLPRDGLTGEHRRGRASLAGLLRVTAQDAPSDDAVVGGLRYKNSKNI
jgi:hypothetical protein